VPESIAPPLFENLLELYLLDEVKAIDVLQHRHKLYYHYIYQII
jgi:hypothetical protein